MKKLFSILISLAFLPAMIASASETCFVWDGEPVKITVNYFNCDAYLYKGVPYIALDSRNCAILGIGVLDCPNNEIYILKSNFDSWGYEAGFTNGYRVVRGGTAPNPENVPKVIEKTIFVNVNRCTGMNNVLEEYPFVYSGETIYMPLTKLNAEYMC